MQLLQTGRSIYHHDEQKAEYKNQNGQNCRPCDSGRTAFFHYPDICAEIRESWDIHRIINRYEERRDRTWDADRDPNGSFQPAPNSWLDCWRLFSWAPRLFWADYPPAQRWIWASFRWAFWNSRKHFHRMTGWKRQKPGSLNRKTAYRPRQWQ